MYAIRSYYAEKEKRQFIRIVTHHPANDVGYDRNKDLSKILELPGCNPDQRIQIREQNSGLLRAKREFYWLRDSNDDRLTFIWQRGELAEKDQWSAMNTAGKHDYSDAGMIWWWMTGAVNGGDQAANPEKFKELLRLYASYNLV